MTVSPVVALSRLPREEQVAYLATLGPDEQDALLRDWRFWSRPEQRAPGWLFRWWLLLTGRGFGKNRTGAEWIVDRCEQFAAAGWRHHVGLVNRTFGHVRSIQIDGESGLLAVCERRGHLLHHPTTSPEARLRIRTGRNEWHTSILEIFTAIDPNGARGKNLHTVHADEVASWPKKIDAEGGTTFTNLDFALRSPCPPGLVPQGIITTTPRPIKLIRDLLSNEYGDTHITRGSMYDNQENLAPAFIRAIEHAYEGTRLGAQEIHGQVLDDVFGALWTLDQIDRVEDPAEHNRRVVGVDPSGGGR